jgi:methionine synthase II (cobalamin-independent)
MERLRGLATGIGSLPHQDAEAALELIFKYVPRIPFWPQLPKRDIREGMIAQFSENLPCLKLNQNGLFFEYREKELEIFYDRLIAQDIDYFKVSQDFALGLHKFHQRLEGAGLEEIGFIKCQVTGPFTFAASINDDRQISLLNNPVFMQAFLKGLAMKALWQIRFFRKFAKDIIVFLDEPYLGCFGSAYTPINREDVVAGLSEITASIKSGGALTGVHCCGNTDWSIFTDIGSIDIISFDAFDFQDRFVLYADNIQGFLCRGGIICWGIVPTQMFTDTETADFLKRKINEGINALVNKGVSRDLLAENLLISPSCGLGTFTPEKAEKVLRLLCETSQLIKTGL